MVGWRLSTGKIRGQAPSFPPGIFRWLLRGLRGVKSEPVPNFPKFGDEWLVEFACD
jgi:hypothetical protein